MRKRAPASGDPLIDMLTAVRLERNLTLSDVGVAAGVPLQSVATWESGPRGITLRSVRRWAAALGYDVALVRRPAPSDQVQ